LRFFSANETKNKIFVQKLGHQFLGHSFSRSICRLAIVLRAEAGCVVCSLAKNNLRSVLNIFPPTKPKQNKIISCSKHSLYHIRKIL
jgi:hypothetical protein